VGSPILSHMVKIRFGIWGRDALEMEYYNSPLGAWLGAVQKWEALTQSIR
jgi:hypothetical protein